MGPYRSDAKAAIKLPSDYNYLELAGSGIESQKPMKLAMDNEQDSFKSLEMIYDNKSRSSQRSPSVGKS